MGVPVTILFQEAIASFQTISQFLFTCSRYVTHFHPYIWLWTVMCINGHHEHRRCLSGNQIHECVIQIITFLLTCNLSQWPATYSGYLLNTCNQSTFNRWLIERKDVGQSDQAVRVMMISCMHDLCSQMSHPAGNVLQVIPSCREWITHLPGGIPFPLLFWSCHAQLMVSAALSVHHSPGWTVRFNGCLIHVDLGHVNCTRVSNYNRKTLWYKRRTLQNLHSQNN